MVRGILGGLGILVALFGALFFTYFISMLRSGGDGKTEPGVYAGLIVFFGGITVCGAYLTWQMFKPRPAASGAARPGTGHTGPRRRAAKDSAPGQAPTPPTTAAEREHRILRLVEAERGRVTVPEVAARCAMTIEEAKAELDRLVLHNVAEIHVTDSGVLVYVFPGFLSDKDKARAADF